MLDALGLLWGSAGWLIDRENAGVHESSIKVVGMPPEELSGFVERVSPRLLKAANGLLSRSTGVGRPSPQEVGPATLR
jgi:hypothetical protein